MQVHYPHDYMPYKRAIEEERFFLVRYMRRRTVGRRCAEIARLKEKGKVLDVGCSTGIFLAEMRRQGWIPFGIEPSETAAKYARERMGLEVFHGMLEDRCLDDQSFDVVTLWDVFEHLFDPIRALEEIQRILKRDGLLVISLPNLDSLEAKLFGKYWVGLDAPRHLYCFKPRLLERALQDRGFEVIARRCFEGGYFTFVASVIITARCRIASQGIQRAGERLLYFPGVRLPFSPLFGAVNKIGKGSIITICSRRK